MNFFYTFVSPIHLISKVLLETMIFILLTGRNRLTKNHVVVFHALHSLNMSPCKNVLLRTSELKSENIMHYAKLGNQTYTLDTEKARNYFALFCQVP
jgi:hypothetical protein